MSGSSDYTYNRFDAFEAKLKAQKEEEVAASEEEEVIEEGMHRDAKTGKVVDKAEIGKTYYPAQPKQKTSVAKRKEEGKKADEESMKVFQKLQKNVDQKRKLALKKEELEMFTAEEIELLGLTEKCDDCDDKKEEKKSKKSGGAKPDYIDADGDGDKEESMKKALEDKKGKKN